MRIPAHGCHGRCGRWSPTYGGNLICVINTRVATRLTFRYNVVIAVVAFAVEVAMAKQ